MKNTKKYILIFVVTVITVFSLQTRSTKAAWGDFDPNFGFLGAHIDSLTNYYPSAVAIQTDGKILVTGYKSISGKQRFFLRRYLPSGQPDVSFGNNGSAISNALINVGSNYTGKAIAIQTNGKIAVAGIASNYPAVWRFNADGSSDGTIGYGGMRFFSNYQTISNAPLAIQNNKLILGVKKQANSSFVVIRLNNNGTIDTTFGAAGEALTGVSGGASSIIVESESGKITISGNHAMPLFGLERLMPNGQSDRDFVFADAVPPLFPPSFFIRLSNQKYVFTASVFGTPQGLPSNYSIFKLDTDGAQESKQTFYSGYAVYLDCPFILAQQQDGKVVASSFEKLYRFNSELDVSAAETKTCSNFSQLSNKTQAILQPDDKIIVAGRTTGNGNLALIRVLAN